MNNIPGTARIKQNGGVLDDRPWQRKLVGRIFQTEEET